MKDSWCLLNNIAYMFLKPLPTSPSQVLIEDFLRRLFFLNSSICYHAMECVGFQGYQYLGRETTTPVLH